MNCDGGGELEDDGWDGEDEDGDGEVVVDVEVEVGEYWGYGCWGEDVWIEEVEGVEEVGDGVEVEVDFVVDVFVGFIVVLGVVGVRWVVGGVEGGIVEV